MADVPTSESLQQNQLEKEPQDNSKYNPSKRRRLIRRTVYERFYWLQGEPNRVEAEAQWELADKEFGMVTPDIDPEDWHSHLELPDSFAAIQTQSQETIERLSRPCLGATENSDEPIADFANSVMTYNMDTTGFDYQAFLSKLNASSRGTSFRMEYWRTDKRMVKMPISVDEETGEIKYKKQEKIDFDDTYTEWKPNEYIYVDEKARHIDLAVDMIEREIINIDEFHRIYGAKPGFFDTEYVTAGGDTTTRSWFRMPKDITEQDVEVLHYHNRSTDSYWVVANNITINDSPLQSAHKELPLIVDYQYRLPNTFWGIGIPKVMFMLSEERKSIRNLNMDRQKIIVGGAYLHNSSFDLDDEDTELQPGKMITVDTNGQPLQNAIQEVRLGDVSASYFKTEEILLEDMRRASGIDDRISVSNGATTATQAAIVKESTLKRINLISISNEMDSVLRCGKLKWSNIQQHYGTPRMEAITEDNEERQQKTYKKISVQGKKFKIVDENGKKVLRAEDIRGASAISLSPKFNKYLDGDFDVTVDANVYTAPSKAIEQTKKTEMFSLMLSNPATMAVMDINGAVEDVLKVNNIDPKKWMKNPGGSQHDMMMLAESENRVMAAGQPLDGTPGATADHTLVHLLFTKTQEFSELDPAIKQIIGDHILQEHDANPATGSSADLMGAYGLNANPSLVPPGMPGGAPVPPPQLAANTSQPQAQTADLQPTNFSQQQ